MRKENEGRKKRGKEEGIIDILLVSSTEEAILLNVFLKQFSGAVPLKQSCTKHCLYISTHFANILL